MRRTTITEKHKRSNGILNETGTNLAVENGTRYSYRTLVCWYWCPVTLMLALITYLIRTKDTISKGRSHKSGSKHLHSEAIALSSYSSLLPQSKPPSSVTDSIPVGGVAVATATAPARRGKGRGGGRVETECSYQDTYTISTKTITTMAVKFPRTAK
jgi:hypothetical protein